ncbi:NUDIX domain-containing protein [Streptomyces sp. NPDC012825]|uniref:NUDIX domain-containing protein n=1 Tax=Streptomyces sp. NPDC012825 TaxID=3364851 RepID=UPI0036ABB01A
MSPLHSVSVAGTVVGEDGRLSAIRRADNGAWELPGGVLELGETLQEGVVRGVLEETGGRERMGEVYAVRLLDAVEGAGPHVRAHDGRRFVS